MLQCRCADQKVCIINDHASRSQSAALTAENFCGLFVNAHEGNTFQKCIEAPLTRFRIARLKHAFIDFRKRHDRQTRTFGLKVL